MANALKAKMLSCCAKAAVVATALVGAVGAQPATAGGYNFTTFDVPGAMLTSFSAINKSGTMAGIYETPDTVIHGFVDTLGAITTIDGPTAIDTEVTGMNKAGSVVGWYRDSSGFFHGYIYGGGELSVMNIGAYTRSWAINDKGDVAGNFGPKANSNKQKGFLFNHGKYHAFAVLNSDFTQPTAMNNSDEVVGYFQDPKRLTHSFLKTATGTSVFDPPGAIDSVATGINDSGQIVGYYVDKSRTIHGYIYASGSFTTVDAPNTSETKLSGIDADGQITGFYNANGNNVAFVYAGGNFAILNADPNSSAFPGGINNDQTVAGDYEDGNGHHGFVATCPRLSRPCS